MYPRRVLALGLLWSALSVCLPAIAAPQEAAVNGLTLAVADFSGPDKELGRFLADTLLTDLAQSERLRMTERAELRQALTELKLQSTGLVEPQQIKRIGKLVGADRLIVGGYHLRDNQIFINMRMLDVRTGRVSPGSAANISGSRNAMFSLIHRLARSFHRRVTGEELALADDASASDSSLARNESSSEWDSIRQRSGMPPNARPNGIVSERDLSALTRQITQEDSILSRRPLSGQNPEVSVTRMRALAALVKATLSSDELSTYEGRSRGAMPPDAGQAPSWGMAYVAAAVDRDWWPAERALRPNDTATWAFVGAVLSHLPSVDERPAREMPRETPRRVLADKETSDGCTGLIVDARGLPIERAMSMRILDENGRVVYPDPRYLPDFDYLQDNGMAAYIRNNDRPSRAGGRPLVVEAVGISRNGLEDVVVTNSTAERIRQENQRGRFLWRWKVCVLVDSGR